MLSPRLSFSPTQHFQARDRVARTMAARASGVATILLIGAWLGGSGAGLALADSVDLPDSESTAQAESADALRWTLASDRPQGEAPFRIFVETEKHPGNPAFRVETEFAVRPEVAASTLMNEMIGASEMPKGQTRTVLERSDGEVVVQTLIDLPRLFSDREVAVRIQHSEDERSGVHRVDFWDANELLPPVEDGVVRLDGTDGYWEFRPSFAGGTQVTYVTRASVGGSIPAVLGDRLLKAQVVDSVQDLRERLARNQTPSVAAPPAP